MKKKQNKILIHGIGNEILTDDGIGPKIVAELQNLFSFPFIDYETTFMGGIGILEYIQDYQVVFFIDAIKTIDGIPGTVYEFTPASFEETLHLSNFHDVSFLISLKFGKHIGLNIPEKIYIIAIEILEDRVFSEEFSEPVKSKYSEILESVKQTILTKVNNLIHTENFI